jgi:hypothetical protein
MFLVDLLKPKVVVELGTQHGDSYCAFCQAVQELGLTAQCYAIDNWDRDPHAGFYGPEVLANLRRYHDGLYGSFSNLVKTTFDDALRQKEQQILQLTGQGEVLAGKVEALEGERTALMAQQQELVAIKESTAWLCIIKYREG